MDTTEYWTLEIGRALKTGDVETLLQAVRHRSDIYGPDLASAARELGVRRERRAVVPLIEVAAEGATDARMEAVTALGLIGDTRAVEPLKTLLGPDSPREVRMASYRSLAMMPGTTGVLKTGLGDADPWVRLYAAEALASVGDASVLPSLRNELSLSGLSGRTSGRRGRLQKAIDELEAISSD